jgi:hypothetical protein
MAQLFPHLQGAFTPVPKTQEQIAREQRLQDGRIDWWRSIAPSAIADAFDTPDYLSRQKTKAGNAYLQAYSQMAGRDSAMQFTPFGAQQDRSAFSSPITQIFNPFLTAGGFGDIGDTSIPDASSPAVDAPTPSEETPTGSPVPTDSPVPTGSPVPSSESTPMPAPSAGAVTSTRPLDVTNAQNTNQRAEQTSNSLMDAWNTIQSMSREGMPVLGSPDLKVKRDAYGRPYTVVSMSPTDEQGRSQKTETLSFGISPETKERQGGSMAPSYTKPQGWQGLHSWEEGSDYSKDIRNAVSQAAQTQVPQIKARQAALASQLTSMGFDPTTMEKTPDGNFEDVQYDPTEEREQIMSEGRSALDQGIDQTNRMESRAAQLERGARDLTYAQGSRSSPLAALEAVRAAQNLRNLAPRGVRSGMEALNQAARKATALPQAGTLRSIQSQYGSAYSSPTGNKIEPLRKKLYGN